jgi:hypothetical protein
MSEQEIKTNLCYNDPENPNSNLDAYEDEDRPQPRAEGCCCDNCFYGRDKLAMQLLKAKRERDEARKELEEYRSIAENIGAVKAVSEKEKAIRERDKAREALMKIEDLFIDGTDIYADRENMGLIARNALEGAK